MWPHRLSLQGHNSKIRDTKKGPNGPFSNDIFGYHQVAYNAAKIKVTTTADKLNPDVVANWISPK